MNPFLATDGYKTSHPPMYPDNTTLVYDNFTPRSNKHAPKGCDNVVVFGSQMVMIQIKESFDNYFFNKDKDEVCSEIKREYSAYLGAEYDITHIEALHDLGYLPIHVKSLPEGTMCPMGVPVLTLYNTHPTFFWLPNFLETLISNLLWKPMTSATIAHQYRRVLSKHAEATDKENVQSVDFQGHDFSMRGMDSLDAVVSSGLGHATSFLGSDSLPVIHGARKYYGETGDVIYSVPATEHSVMCAGGKEDEIDTFRRLMSKFPTGILSIVSDTWDLWKVCTEYLPQLKEEILARDGKIVIRPDSGDPVDIICGSQEILLDREKGQSPSSRFDKFLKDCEINGLDRYNSNNPKGHNNEAKGVIELLWDIFGGTVNEQGYKVLDPHIGAIYGDSITIERANKICKRLEAKGFASTNIVLGIGSFTYQFNTRDTFGFAMKATYVEVQEPILFPESEKGNFQVVGREIFKDPITDDGTKKSAKGLLTVIPPTPTSGYVLVDGVDWESESAGALQTIFKDGKFSNQVTLTEIRERLRL